MFSHFSALHKKYFTSPLTAGFSMIELMVSISIVVLVLSITLTRQSAFNSSVLLRSQAYEIALDMREIQLSAVSATSDGSGVFRTTLGVHFDEANPSEYIFFRDLDGDNFYDSGATPAEEFGGQGLIDPRFEIRSIASDVGILTNDEVSIVFERPNFDALFYETSNNAQSANVISIVIGTVGGSGSTCADEARVVNVSAAGQITVVEC
jgi:prepilin-type N-terminal cleavage/methylation domain-containing protein